MTTPIGTLGIGALILALGTSCGAGGASSGGDAGPAPCAPGSTVAEVEENCPCNTYQDCEAADPQVAWACSNSHKCLGGICTSSDDCTTAPNTVCEDAICLPPACGDDGECSTGQQCIDSACVTAFTVGDVAGCEVLPAHAELNAGGSKAFWVITRDANGDEINYEGSVTWGVSSLPGATAIPAPASSTTATISGSTAAGSGTVDAMVGMTICAGSSVTAFAAPATGTLRVTVADQFAGTVIADATVIDGSGAVLTSGGDGTYAETNPHPTGKNTVSVFRSGFHFVTVVDTSATDLFIPLPAAAPLGKFAGILTDTDFNNLSIPTGTVHIDVSGSSIAGNWMDVSLTTLLGSLVPTMIELGGTTATNVNLPDGIAIGLGPTMFKGNDSILATEGVRSLWSLGGNITLQIVLNAVSMATGGNVDVGSLLMSVLPVLGELESGVTGGVQVAAGEQGTLSPRDSTSGTNAHLALNTLLRLHLSATVPDLPTYYFPTDAPGSPSGQLNGALVAGGILASPQGIVPLGITGGVSDTTNNRPDQVAGYMGGPDGVIPFDIAPKSGGLEGSPFLMLALAFDQTSLGNAFANGTSGPLYLSGNVVLPGPIKYDDQAVTSVAFPGTTFLGFPVQPSLTTSSRMLTLPPTDVPGVAFHRLDIMGTPGTWNIYFPAGETGVEIPVPPSGFGDTDPLAAVTSVSLQSMTLNLSTPALSYDDIVSFQAAGVTLDDLSHQIDQFSVEPVPVQP